MRKARFCLLLIMAVLLGTVAAFAQDEKPGETGKVETEHTVYIPYKDLEKVFEKTGRGVFMPYEEFPWFKEAPVGKILNVTEPRPGHFYWPDLDVDLTTEIIEYPEKYPLSAH